MNVVGPHRNQPLVITGVPLAQADAAILMLHGRGAEAANILSLAAEFEAAPPIAPPSAPLGQALPRLAYLAPQAAENSWYPQRFIAPRRANEPWLSSALHVVSVALAHIAAGGIPLARTLLLGFSQGACLALDFALRHPARYGAVIGLSGGLIGAADEIEIRSGSLAGTPVFLGCSDSDAHIPLARVQRSAQVLEAMQADVCLQIYPHMGHSINQDEIQHIRGIIHKL